MSVRQSIALIRCAALLIVLALHPPERWTPLLGLLCAVGGLYSLAAAIPPIGVRLVALRGDVVVAMDAVLAALLAYVTGGLSSPLICILYLPVLEASLVLSFRSSVATALWTTCWLGYFGVIAGFNQTISMSAQQRLWAYGTTSLCLAMVFNGLAQVARRYARQIQHLEAEKERLSDLADHDPLTGACNRRAFWRRFETELDRFKLSDVPFTVALLDVDDMKRINDERGHEAGDSALVRLTDHLVQCSRNKDVVCRYGGDEFAVLLPMTTADGAAIWRRRLEDEADPGVPEFSIGCVSSPDMTPSTTADMAAVMRAADAELYADKTLRARAGGEIGARADRHGEPRETA